MEYVRERVYEWEARPSGLGARTWHGGRELRSSSVEWAATVSKFMGCGFRVGVPSAAIRSGPVGYAQESAERVADALSTSLDEAAWDDVARTRPPFVVEGGWEYRADGSFGPPWTRVAPGGVTHVAGGTVRSSRLPWTWNSESATAGLSTISTMEADRAERHLKEVGAELGLWFNHREELCMSTAGPLLVKTGMRSWAIPDGGAGLVCNWAFSGVVSLLAPVRRPITLDVLQGSVAVCVVSDLANVLLVKSHGDVSVDFEPDEVAELLDARDQLVSRKAK